MTIVAISGGFDCLHVGHINMIEGAAKLGRVHVYLNTDEWLMRKKGYVFMPLNERARILWALKGVDMVIPVIDEDDTVCKTIQTFKPDIFANGGDRTAENTPEMKTCLDLKIPMMFGIGGQKIQSSSELVRKVINGR